MSACPPWNGLTPKRCATRSSRSATRCGPTPPSINRLNVYPVPDGDTGTNMARTLDAVVAEMDGAGADELDADVRCHQPRLADGGARQQRRDPVARSCAASRRTLQGASATSTGARRVAEALDGRVRGRLQAVLKPIEGTILTVVRESAAGAERAAADGRVAVEVLRAARDAGQVALDRTPEQLPVLKDAGVVDAGGAGFLLLLDAALHVVDGEPLPGADERRRSGAVGAAFEAVARPASRDRRRRSTSASSATR